jgi:hypothetical protein
MEPRISMSVYAIVVATALSALAARGFGFPAAAIAAGIAITAATSEMTYRSASERPLAHAPAIAQALIVGVTVASCAVYVSSLVDWYWILPKVSGMIGLAPCERAGGERFAAVTKMWFFHRAAATTIVTFVLAGVPGYMAGRGAGGAEGAGWAVLGSALAIGYNSVNSGLTAAFRYAFNAGSSSATSSASDPSPRLPKWPRRTWRMYPSRA